MDGNNGNPLHSEQGMGAHLPIIGERRWWYSLGLQQTIACLASGYEEAWKTMQHHRMLLYNGATTMGRPPVSGAANQAPVPIWGPIVATADFVEWVEAPWWEWQTHGDVQRMRVPGGWRVKDMHIAPAMFLSVPMSNNVHVVEVPSGLTLGVIELATGYGFQ